MSDASNPSFTDFGKLVPGFDFLQNLAKQASGGASQSLPQMPNLGAWVAPTLNVEELDKRIQELKAVQFWLDQNAVALKATIQALEVQKMTLATLKGMNFNMSEVANAFTVKASSAAAVSAAGDKAKTFAGLEIPPSSFQAARPTEPASQAPAAEAAGNKAKPAKAEPAANPGVVDPMQWWGALTQQFQAIAADAMKDTGKKAPMASMQNAGKAVAEGARAAMNTALRSSQAWPTPTAAKPAAPAAARPKAAAKAKAAAPGRKVAAKKTSRAAGKTTR